jgi:hypothetical protein
MPSGTPGDVELDLDGTEQPPLAPARSSSTSWWRFAWAAGGLAVGLLLGHAWLPAGAPEAAAPGPATAAPVLLAFGASGPSAVDQVARIGHEVTVPVPAVVINQTSAPLVVRALLVSGPGAGLGSGFGMQQVVFPLRLPPGEAIPMPFRLTSDCSVAVRPLPRITLVVGPDDGSAGRPVEVRIPDLDSLWGRTLDPSLCLD